MPVLSIYTKRYNKELMRYFSEKADILDKKQSLSTISVDSENFSFNDFADFLRTLIISNNSAVNGSMELCSIIKKQISGFDTYVLNRINQYFSEHNEMNLEGFINFRLSEYVDAVSLFLYSAVKNEYKKQSCSKL